MLTSNLILLAAEGARFAKRHPNGLYSEHPHKRGATHKITCTRPRPRYLKKDVPPGCLRIAYDDPNKFLEFPNTDEGREAAAGKLHDWQTLSAGASPTSAAAIPIGKRYKNFVQARTEAAKDGSLYDKHKKKDTAMSKKTPGKNAANKDVKNGMTRPKDGTTTGKVWDIADKLKERAKVLAECAKRKINPATAMTQFGKWRVYNGLAGTRKVVAKRKPAPPAKRKPAPPARARKAKPAPPAAPAPVEAAAG